MTTPSHDKSKDLNPDFVRLLESLANGVVIADPTGTIIYSNQFLDNVFGYAPGELLGLKVETLMPAELRSLHAHHRGQYNSSPETRLMGAGRDLLARRKDGSVFPVEVGLSPITTLEGVQVVAIVTDISKRKHAEQRSLLQKDVALILSKAKNIQVVAVNLLETVGTALGWRLGALWLVDAGAEVLRNVAIWRSPSAAAPEFEAGTKGASFRKGECLLGQVWKTQQSEWISDLSTNTQFLRREAARAAGLGSIFELPILIGEQTIGVLEFFSHEIRPLDEAVVEIAGAVASQIGQFVERKRSEQTLGVFEERYRSLFENAVFGIFRSTASGEIVDANPAMMSMLGYERIEEVLQLNLNKDVYKNPQTRQKLIEESRTADRFNGFEAEWKTKAGGTIQVRLSGRTIRGDDGSLVGLEAIVEDISQRTLLEQTVSASAEDGGYRPAGRRSCARF